MTRTSPTIPLKAARPVAAKPSPKLEPDSAASVGRVLTWLKMYWLTILFLGSLLGAGLAYLAWTMLPSKYESYAKFRVASSPFLVSSNRDTNRSRTDFTTYLKTTSQSIKNEFVLNKALSLEIDGVRISDLATLRDQKQPLQFLDDELNVSFSEGSELITLTMKGHQPDDLRRILNAVQQAFMEEVVEKDLKRQQAHLQVLNSILVEAQKTLNERTQKITDPLVFPAVGGDLRAPSTHLPGGVLPAVASAQVGPPDWVKKQIAMNRVKRAMELQEQVNDLPVMIESQKARISLLKKQLETPVPTPMAPVAAQVAPQPGPPPEAIAAAVDRDPDVLRLEAEEQRIRREYNLERVRYANPNAPGIVAKLDRANEKAAEVAQLRAEKTALYSQAKPAAAPSATSVVQQPQQPMIHPKQGEYDGAVLRLGELEALYANSKQRLIAALDEVAKLPADADPIKPVENKLLKADEKKGPDPDSSRLEVEDSMFRSLVSNAAALKYDLSSPKRVDIWQGASTPMQKDTRKQLLGSLLAGLLGFAFVGLVVFGYEASVKKVCSLADVTGSTTAPVVGVVPWEPNANLDTIRRGEIHDSINKLRAYLTQSWLPSGANLVTITSAVSDEGKSFTAFSLANSLAEAGYKTLLIDFDLRSPKLHEFAKIENKQGVCELLRGESDFLHTIHTLPSGLQLLPSGTWSEDVRRVSGSGRLEQLLACLKQPYDCVILHGHPLLMAAESIEVARRSDVVVLCALYRETNIPYLKKANERLMKMELPFTSLVYLGATPQEALC